MAPAIERAELLSGCISAGLNCPLLKREWTVFNPHVTAPIRCFSQAMGADSPIVV